MLVMIPASFTSQFKATSSHIMKEYFSEHHGQNISAVIPSSYAAQLESTSLYIMNQFNIHNLDKMFDSLHSIRSNALWVV